MDTTENTKLETLHQHLGEVKKLILKLQEYNEHQKVHSTELYPVHEALLFLEDMYGGHEALSKHLMVPSTTIIKIMNLRGEFKVRDAVIVSDRVSFKLKFFEDSLTTPTNIQAKVNQDTEEKELTNIRPTQSENIKAIVWAVNPNNTTIKTKIILISELLDQIVKQVETTNLPEANQALTAIEKAQLIAILQTVLSILKSPLVEQGIIAKSVSFLKKISKKTTEEKSQEALGKIADEGAELLKDLIKDINWDSISF